MCCSSSNLKCLIIFRFFDILEIQSVILRWLFKLRVHNSGNRTSEGPGFRKPGFPPLERTRNPPRPLASKRVDPVTKQRTLQTSQNLKTSPQGGGFTLPLPPPRRSGPLRRSFSWITRALLDPSKCVIKMCIFCLWTRFGTKQSPFWRIWDEKVTILIHFGWKSHHLPHLGRESRHVDAFWDERVAILTHFGRNSRHFYACWTKKSPFWRILDKQ